MAISDDAHPLRQHSANGTANCQKLIDRPSLFLTLEESSVIRAARARAGMYLGITKSPSAAPNSRKCVSRVQSPFSTSLPVASARTASIPCDLCLPCQTWFAASPPSPSGVPTRGRAYQEIDRGRVPPTANERKTSTAPARASKPDECPT